MKKIIPVLIVGILVLSGIGAVAIIKDKTPIEPLLDELDQSQEVMTENALAPVGQVPTPDPINVQVAQSFIPTKEILTRAELFIGANSTASHPYYLAIREELTGDDLTLTDVGPCVPPVEEFGWVEFDFDDVMITPGQTYYIVSYTENVT